MASRTDAILGAIAAELEKRRGELDGADGLRLVSLSVRLNERTGEPRSVLCRTESESTVAGGAKAAVE